jgi:hypothetical protein
MKSKLSILAIAILFVLSSCQKEELVRDFHEAADKSSQSELKASHGKGKQAVLNFRAHLSGDQEVADRTCSYECYRPGNIPAEQRRHGIELQTYCGKY